MGTMAPTQHLPCTGPPTRSCSLREQVVGITHSPPGPGTIQYPTVKSHMPFPQTFSSPPQAEAPKSPRAPLPCPSAEPSWCPPCLHPYLLLTLLGCLEHRQVVGSAGLLGFLVLLPQCLPKHWEGTRKESPSGGGRVEMEGAGNISHLSTKLRPRAARCRCEAPTDDPATP